MVQGVKVPNPPDSGKNIGKSMVLRYIKVSFTESKMIRLRCAIVHMKMAQPVLMAEDKTFVRIAGFGIMPNIIGQAKTGRFQKKFNCLPLVVSRMKRDNSLMQETNGSR